MPPRFVILEHTVNGTVHFDLMLEVEGQEKLRTYQLATWPLAVGESCVVKRLEDHRRVYLEFEGEITGGRGVVKRVLSGTWSGDLTLKIADGTAVGIAISGNKALRTA